MTSHLLDPVRLGALELPNRVLMAPLTRSRADNPDYAPTESMVRYYAQRAGAGLIVSEATLVSARGRGYPYTPGIWSDAQLAGWRRVTDAVHAAGGRIVCQLWHCGRLSLSEFHDGELPVAPSAVNAEWKMFSADGLKTTPVPHALSRDEIAAIVADFGRAAHNAVLAGFDGVEIHSSNGYLIHQFISPLANRRDDEYGGSFENRARIFFEVLDAVAACWEPSRIGFRLNPMMNRMHGMRVEADTLPMFEHVVRRANDAGLAYLHRTEPYLPKQLDGASGAIDEVARHFRGIATIPIVANGGFDQARAESAIAAGVCDAVAFGRPFISNPDLVERFRSGAPLNRWDADTFYQGGDKGYIDYPTLGQ